jgi:hypothetical protein
VLRIAVIASFLLVGGFAVAYFEFSGHAAPAKPSTYADKMGTHYTPAVGGFAGRPKVVEIPIPLFAGAEAIWGGTGRDSSGHIWIGVCARGDGGAAHLFEYVPETGKLVDHGDTVSELKQAGVYREGEGQIKIHSKIVQADDGYLYFASLDEEGESASRGLAPKWGGHFWRFKPGNSHWEHLRAVPEGIVSVAGNGPWIYGLGYWDHVLYQYDTRKRSWRQARVGSVRAHVSRNIVVDRHGHAYVPRAREWRPNETASHPAEPFSAELVEFDTDLKEVGSTPLQYYADVQAGRDSHGLTGLSYLADGSIVVATSIGQLYRITPSDSGAAKVEALGWLHPTGKAYAGSLFPLDGERYVTAVTRSGAGFEWVTYDLTTEKSQAQKLPFEVPEMLLYGSSTRDDKGRFYVVGLQQGSTRGSKPLLLQIELPN